MSDRAESGPSRARLMQKREELARQLAEAEVALPAHSVRPQQMQRVMELEEALAEVEEALAAGAKAPD